MRWIDGMNVIGTRPDGWWRDRHGAMTKLVDQLEHWAGAGQQDVTVVFERLGRSSRSPAVPPLLPPDAPLRIAHELVMRPAGGAKSVEGFVAANCIGQSDDEVTMLTDNDDGA
jgi:hypothetical protein